MGQNAPAGTLLTSMATTTFTDGTNAFFSYSDAVSTRVAQVLGITGTMYANNISAAQGSVITIPVTVNNTGNGLDDFTIAVQDAPTNWNVYVLNDANNDGVWQTTEWESISSTGNLDRGQSKKFFLRYEPPWGDKRTDGVNGMMTVLSSGGTGDVSGMSTPHWDQGILLGRNAPMYHVFNKPTGETLGADVGGDSAKAYYAGASASCLLTNIQPWQGAFDRIVLTSPLSGAPGVTSDRVMWVATDGRVVTIDKGTKKAIRTQSAGSGASFIRSPAVYGSNAIVAMTGGQLCAISRDGVAVLYSTKMPSSQIRTDPLVVGNEVFVGTDRGEIACFDAVSLGLKWLDRLDTSTYFTGRLSADGASKTLVGYTNGGKVYAYNTNSRFIRWTAVMPSSIVGNICTAPGSAFILTSNKLLYGWECATGKLLPGFPFTASKGTASLTTGLTTSTYTAPDGTPYVWFNTADSWVYAVNTKNALNWFYGDLRSDNSKFYSNPGVAANKATFGASKGWIYVYDPK